LTEKNSRRGRNPGLFVLSADTRKMNLKNILDRNSIKKIMKKIHIPQPLPMENKISNRIIRETHQVYIKPRLEKGHGRDPRRFPNINKNPLRNGPTKHLSQTLSCSSINLSKSKKIEDLHQHREKKYH
jgi:hypothetical protein